MAGTELKLSRPVIAHGEEVSVLHLREPTGADLAACGMPFKVGDGVIDFNPKVILELGARLAAVPPSTIGALRLADFTALQGVIFGFFGQDQPTEVQTEVSLTPTTGSTSRSTLLGSGASIQPTSSDSLGLSSEPMPTRRRA